VRSYWFSTLIKIAEDFEDDHHFEIWGFLFIFSFFSFHDVTVCDKSFVSTTRREEAFEVVGKKEQKDVSETFFEFSTNFSFFIYFVILKILAHWQRDVISSRYVVINCPCDVIRCLCDVISCLCDVILLSTWLNKKSKIFEVVVLIIRNFSFFTLDWTQFSVSLIQIHFFFVSL